MLNVLPLISSIYFKKETTVFLLSKQLLFVLKCLKLHFNYQYSVLSAISGVDFLSSKYRFNIVYELLSVTFTSRLRLKVALNEITFISSSVDVFKNAN